MRTAEQEEAVEGAQQMALDMIFPQEQVQEQDQGLYDWIAEQEEGPVMWGMFHDFSRGTDVRVLETQHCPHVIPVHCGSSHQSIWLIRC